MKFMIHFYSGVAVLSDSCTKAQHQSGGTPRFPQCYLWSLALPELINRLDHSN